MQYLLDPNTASVCSPTEIREMVDEMFDTQKERNKLVRLVEKLGTKNISIFNLNIVFFQN